MKVDEIIEETAKMCRSFHAKEVILYGSRAKGTARERSDIDIAVSGAEDFDLLAEKVEDLPTLYSVDLLNMDTCRNQLLLEDIRQYADAPAERVSLKAKLEVMKVKVAGGDTEKPMPQKARGKEETL